MSAAGPSLTTFLAENKKKFLADVAKDGAKEWTIVMGNEAGDLDSIASAIGYSYLSPKQPTIALIQTPRPDLRLRPENLFAFEIAKLAPDQSDVLTFDDLPVPPAQIASTYALVDHNNLLPLWRRPNGSPHGESVVVGIIDHHEDEHEHSSADPRNITVPLGSCASLVALTFRAAWESPSAHAPPPELTTLLLTAMYIDTSGLKEDGKAQHIDHTAAAFLESPSGGSSFGDADAAHKFRKHTTKLLKDHKEDVHALSSLDLLRRDYKAYAFVNAASGDTIRVGLSTVPIGTKVWLEKVPEGSGEYREALNAWARTNSLDVVGVLNTFKSPKGHKRREMLLLIGGTSSSTNATALTQALVQGLEGNPDLQMEAVELEGNFAGVLSEGAAGEVRMWKQENTEATRKIIAPAFKRIIESGPAMHSTLEKS